MNRRILAIALAALASFLLLPAKGLAAAPKWRIGSLANTATAAPNPKFEYHVQIENVGDAPTDGSEIQLLAELPAGMVAKGASFLDESTGSLPSVCFDAADGFSPVAGASTVLCKTSSVLADHPRVAQKLTLAAEVEAGAAGPLLAHFSVSGGGAASTTTVDPTELSNAPTPFGIDGFDSAFLDPSGDVSTVAGSHPAENVTTFNLNTLADPSPVRGQIWPVEPLRDAYVDLSPGVVGNPGVVGRCTLLQLSNSHDLQPLPLCPPDSQVGLATARFKGLVTDNDNETVPLFNLYPSPGAAATFGFNILGTVVVLDATVGSGDDYRVKVGTTLAPQALALIGNTVEFWGNPADESHDSERACPGENGPLASGLSAPADCPEAYDRPANQAFLRNPTSCTEAGEGLLTGLHVDSWTNPGAFAEASSVSHAAPGFPYPTDEWGPTVGIEGCEAVPFSPGFSGAPPNGAQAGQPTAFSFDLTMPQQGLEEPEAISESDLRKAVVTLPAGVRLNPSSADGLGACTPGQIGLLTPAGQEHARFSDAPATCPDNAKLGTMTIETPLLDHPIQGAAYLASQGQNPFGSMTALYLVAHDEASGVTLKLPGKVDLDPNTGQITSTFDDNPQLPFTHLHLELRSGSRAPLTAPDACGTYNTHTELTGWSGAVVTSDSSFTIENGCGGGFDPQLEAGTKNPLAGQFSPFLLRLTREDGSQEIGRLGVTLPPGLLGSLKGVTYCPDATLAAISTALGTGAAQEASPSCPASSQVGTVTVGAGAGPSPFFTRSGRAYLAGPYKGAPVSLAVVTPAVAGPFDLGSVVIRNPVTVDPTSGQISQVSDPLPRVLYGIPLDLRDIRVALDRDHFILNPTSCEPMKIDSSVSSTSGASANPSVHFQVAGCERLGFKPRLSLKLSGGTTRAKHPAVTAVMRPRVGDANAARISVALPHSEFIAQNHIRTICTRVQFAADACPADSIYGTATVYAPILDYYLTGNVYLRSSSHPLPDMVLKLGGPPSQPIEVDAVGRIDTDKAGGIRTTFEGLPDAPISEVVLRLPGGKKSLLENSTNICLGTHRATMQANGQNGVRYESRPKVIAKCGKAASHKGAKHGGYRHRSG